MPNAPVISGLLEKRSELLSELLEIERNLQGVRDSVAKIDAAILLLDPAVALKSVKEVLRQARLRTTAFGYGEVRNTVLKALRESSIALSTRDITLSILLPLGLDGSAKAYRSTNVSVQRALHDLENAGLVKMIGRSYKGSMTGHRVSQYEYIGPPDAPETPDAGAGQ